MTDLVGQMIGKDDRPAHINPLLVPLLHPDRYGVRVEIDHN